MDGNTLMPITLPGPLAILGVPSPREVFDEFVSLKNRLDNLEKKLETQEKKIERQTKKIDRLETKLTNLKKQLTTIKKKTQKPTKKRKSKESLSPTNKLRRILREKRG